MQYDKTDYSSNSVGDANLSGSCHLPAGFLLAAAILMTTGSSQTRAAIGVGAMPPRGAEMLFDGSRKMLDEKWTYWEGPRFRLSLPVKWKIQDDPVDSGTVMMTWDPAADSDFGE